MFSIAQYLESVSCRSSLTSSFLKMEQDFTLPLDDETSSRLLQKNCSSSQMSWKMPSVSLQHQSCVAWCSQQKVPQGVISMYSICYLQLRLIHSNFVTIWLKKNWEREHFWDEIWSGMSISNTWMKFEEFSVHSCNFWSSACDQEMASLLLLVHPLPPPAGGPKSLKISAMWCSSQCHLSKGDYLIMLLYVRSYNKLTSVTILAICKWGL